MPAASLNSTENFMFEQVLGIVLYNNRLDFCLLDRGIDSKRIAMSVSESIPDGLEGKGTRETGKFINALFSQMDIRPDIIYSALPSSYAMFRHVHLPFTDINKISKVYPFEIEQSLPCPLNDLILDFHIMDSCREKGVDLLVAAVPKKLLEDHLAILTSAGLEPNAITLDCAGLFSLNYNFFKKKDNATNGILDINRNKATLLVSSRRRIITARQIDFKELEYLMRELKLTVTSLVSTQNLGIEKIIITGDKELGLQVQELIRAQMDINTEAVYTFNGLHVKGKEGERHSNTFLPAPLGLCMIKRFKRGEIWNYRKGSYAYQKTLSISKGMIFTLTAFIFLIITLCVINLKARYDYYNNRINILQDETRTIIKQAFAGKNIKYETVEDLKAAILREDNIQKKYHKYLNLDLNMLDILSEISIKIPSEYNVQIQEISFQDGKTRIRGKIDSFETLEKLIKGLEKSELFKEIKTEESNIRGKANQVSFTLILEIKAEKTL